MGEAGTVTSTDEPLAAIASFSSALDQQGLDYGLLGGWAVDFWATLPPCRSTIAFICSK